MDLSYPDFCLSYFHYQEEGLEGQGDQTQPGQAPSSPLKGSIDDSETKTALCADESYWPS